MVLDTSLYSKLLIKSFCFISLWASLKIHKHLIFKLTLRRKFKEYRYLYVHVRDIHSQEDYLKIRQTKLKGLNWFCDRCECYFASEANHKAIECRKYREMAGIDEPDDLQWPKETIKTLIFIALNNKINWGAW